jgi:glycosyltransferase involved in cell wall biosynthesis
MKIALISKSADKGGASIACRRLMEALNKNNTEAYMMVQEYSGDSNYIISSTRSQVKKVLNFERFIWERLCFLPFEKSKEVRFAYSLANTGEDISKIKEVKEADIINVHWINQGYLSLKSIRTLSQMGKPIVWTLHDMWAFTGGCHYAGDCKNFQTQCRFCPFLKNPSKKDLSSKIFRKKLKILFEKNQKKIVFVTSSNWLSDEAKKSSLLQGYRIESIPIPVNTNLFKPLNKDTIRKKYSFDPNMLYVLFAATNINDKRKGFSYFLDSLNIIKEKYRELSNKLSLVVFGKSKEEILSMIPFPVVNLHFISSQEIITEIFNAVNLFVIPSLEDNLPNIIMESLSCGTPVVGFKTGGIPQMIDHFVTGYLADYKSSDDLARGIYWCLCEADENVLSTQSRTKALNFFSEKVVANQYLNLYKDVISTY